MPRKQLPGGFTPFSPEPRPNAFSSVGPEDLIERRGESALWFRLQPCPCDENERLPGCLACYDGYILTHQKDVSYQNELASTGDCGGRTVFTRFAPVTRVDKLLLALDGETFDLTDEVRRMDGNQIEIQSELKYWNAVYADYRAALTESVTIELDVATPARRVQVPDTVTGVVVACTAALRDPEGDGVFEAFDYLPQTTFDALVFRRNVAGKIRATITVFEPIKVAYRTFELGESHQGQRAPTLLEEGKVEIVVPQGMKMGANDILTLTTSDKRVSLRVPPSDGPVDRLLYGPIKEIFNCYSRKGNTLVEHEEGVDFMVVGSDRIEWTNPKPVDGYSIMYSYHPSFRIEGPVELGSAGNRDLPRQYKAQAISSYNVQDWKAR